MNRAERAALVDHRLEELYPSPRIPLQHTDPYTLLVAVVLSAQCTDEKVNQVTPRLFAVAERPEEMARVTVERIQPIIHPCGLSQRKAQAIIGLSRLLVERHDGEVPRTFEELEALPGVGHKTASVVMAQAFGIPAFPVDTHIHRLAARWGLSNGTSVERTERDLKRLFPRERWIKLHLQMIYYGREHCSARGCDGRHCDICSRLHGVPRPAPAEDEARAPGPTEHVSSVQAPPAAAASPPVPEAVPRPAAALMPLPLLGNASQPG